MPMKIRPSSSATANRPPSLSMTPPPTSARAMPTVTTVATTMVDSASADDGDQLGERDAAPLVAEGAAGGGVKPVVQWVLRMTNLQTNSLPDCAIIGARSGRRSVATAAKPDRKRGVFVAMVNER